VPKRPFDEAALPSFDETPGVLLVGGPLDFFVEEAAARAAEALAAGETERIRFDDEAAPEAVTDALLNRSLFSPRRIVEIDATRYFGTEAPGELADAAVAAWDEATPAGRRKAFRHARALLAALSIERGSDPMETGAAVARKVKRSASAEALGRILAELPEERSSPGLVVSAIRTLLERDGNDGVVALLTAIQPPFGIGLAAEIAKKGLVLEVSVDDRQSPDALKRLARARAREREVTLDADAVERLLRQTSSKPAVFAAELGKLLEWAGKGGRVRAGDVRAFVEDEASEDVYGFFDVLSRRDAAAALAQLERMFSGHPVVMGKQEIDTEEYWPIRFLGFLSSEIRRMLLMRERLDDPAAGYAAGMSAQAFQSRVLPRLQEMDRGGGRPMASGHPFAVFKLAERSAHFRTEELARALAGAADVDVQLKNSTPPLAALTAYVGRVIAGD
jgi:DNA polymerase III delta subunit